MNYNDLALAEEESKLTAALKESRNLLIEAPTGSGKSLFIPYFLSKHCKGRVVVLQPRRIAALALAQFSARLHGEPCGKTVGYQFRQESCKSADTRILFQTYGNFLHCVDSSREHILTAHTVGHTHHMRSVSNNHTVKAKFFAQKVGHNLFAESSR